MRETDIDPDSLQREDWNSLLNNYSKHDIGEAYFTGRIEQIGLHVENWGIDKRHHDDGLIFDNKMDLRLWEPLDGQDSPPAWPETDEVIHNIGETWNLADDIVTREWKLRGVADVKTKASKSWMGTFNLRHLVHYTHWADEYDVPTFIYMTAVDAEAERVGEEDFLTPISADWDYSWLKDHYNKDSDVSLTYGEIKDEARECPIAQRVWRAPDGNLVVDLEDEHKYNWDYVVDKVL